MPSDRIQWFPGHMAKTRRMISENLKDVDLTIELLDARIPQSSRNPEIRALLGEKKQPRLQELHTPFEDDEGAWEREYPRPSMRRESWQSLCGEWELSVQSEGRTEPVGKIRVPFPPESRLSGQYGTRIVLS